MSIWKNAGVLLPRVYELTSNSHRPGEEKPNKKYYDPRAAMRSAEVGLYDSSGFRGATGPRGLWLQSIGSRFCLYTPIW